MRSLTRKERDLIAPLATGPKEGHHLGRAAAKYVTLARLEDRGILASEPLGDDGGRIYQLTEAGQAALAAVTWRKQNNEA